MKTYIKNNGLSRLIIIGRHPTKDFLAASDEAGETIRWVPFIWFFENFTEET